MLVGDRGFQMAKQSAYLYPKTGDICLKSISNMIKKTSAGYANDEQDDVVRTPIKEH